MTGAGQSLRIQAVSSRDSTWVREADKKLGIHRHREQTYGLSDCGGGKECVGQMETHIWKHIYHRI